MGNIFTQPLNNNINQNIVDTFEENDDENENSSDESYKILNDNNQLKLSNGKINQEKLYIVKKLNSNRLKYYTMKQFNTKISEDKFQYALNKVKKLMFLEKHENIISYLDSYQEVNKILFIMDYHYGNTLKERIELQLNKRIHSTNNNIKTCNFSETLIWYWFLNILNALCYLHNNEIYHGDIKPDNLFIDSRTGALKIGNFSLDKLDENYFKMLNVRNYTSLLYKPPEYRFINDYKFNFNDESLFKYLNGKCDVFSLGCILFELVYLKRAILNPFLKETVLVHEQHENEFPIDLISLIDSCLEYNHEKRLEAQELFDLESVKKYNSIDSSVFYSAYKEQIIPTIDFKKNFSFDHLKSNCIKVYLDNNFKPSSIISLKYGQNLIIISLNKYLNESDYSFLYTNSNIDPYIQQQIQSKLVIYSEFGEYVYEFYSYLVEMEGKFERKIFNFKIYSMCIDEENCHIYISTDTNGILRLKYTKNFHNKELIFDSSLNTLNVNKKIGLNKVNFTAKCIHLVVNSLTNDRHLLISDNLTSNLMLLKFKTEKCKIDYNIEWCVQIHDKVSIFQMFTTNNEIICLLNDLVTIQVYYLTTGLFKRDNKHKLSLFNIDTIQALALDSDFNIYSTDGYQFYSININTFDLYNVCSLKNSVNTISSTHRQQPLFNSIVFMQILINGKIILLKDVVQTENSILYILTPMFSSSEDESN